MKSAKKGKKQGRARHLDGPFAHFTISKIGGVDPTGMDAPRTKTHTIISACSRRKCQVLALIY
jgi:hypothetical protein